MKKMRSTICPALAWPLAVSLLAHSNSALGAPPPAPAAPSEVEATEPTVEGPATNWNGLAEASFSNGQLETYVETEGAITVVAAGPSSPALDAAAAAIAEELQRSAKVGQILDTSTAGDLSGLDDQAIVNRLTAYPVERVVVVRAFPDTSGGGAVVVVSVLDKAAEVRAGFNVSLGTPVSANAGSNAVATSASGDGGVTDEAASAVSDTVNEIEDEFDERLSQYKKNYLWLQNLYGIRVDTGQVVASAVFVRQGRQGKNIEGAEFYDIIDRPELKKKYRVRRGLRLGLGIGLPVVGLGLALGAVPVMLQGFDTLSQPEFGSGPVQTDQHQRMQTAGIAMMATGGGLMIAGTLILATLRSHPINGSELVDLVEEHNDKLRQELGLREKDVAKKNIDVGVGFARSGGQVVLKGRF